MNSQSQKNEYYDGGEEEIDINKLNELEKEKFEKNFESIISYKDNNEPKKKIKKLEKENTILSTSTCASVDENPLTKFNSIKSKIDQLEKELKLYSENQDMLNCDQSVEQCLQKLKKLKEATNFISQSKNFFELKKIIDSQKINKDKKLDNYTILKNKMSENLNLHLINRANIINKLKSQNPEEYNDLDYELYLTPETKKIKRISKILEIKEKIKQTK